MSGVHPLIHRRLGSVDVPIKVDDSQLALDVLRDRLRVCIDTGEHRVQATGEQ